MRNDQSFREFVHDRIADGAQFGFILVVLIFVFGMLYGACHTFRDRVYAIDQRHLYLALEGKSTDNDEIAAAKSVRTILTHQASALERVNALRHLRAIDQDHSINYIDMILKHGNQLSDYLDRKVPLPTVRIPSSMNFFAILVLLCYLAFTLPICIELILFDEPLPFKDPWVSLTIIFLLPTLVPCLIVTSVWSLMKGLIS